MPVSRSRFTFRKLSAPPVAAAVLALASQVEIPFEPVPVTLQSLAVVLIGFLLGPVSGFVATVIWLAAGAAGLPSFAGGASGIDHLGGPTAGYLFAFPLAGALAGHWGGPRTQPTILRLFCVALGAHALILAVGAAWLATTIGATGALERGVLPFVIGSVLKSACAALAVWAVRRAARP